MTIQAVAEVEVWAIFVLSWVFVIEHTLLSRWEARRYGSAPWWRSVLGWILTLAVASLGVALGFPAAAYVWPVLATYGWFLWAYVLSFGLIGAVVLGKIVARAWLFRRAGRGPK